MFDLHATTLRAAFAVILAVNIHYCLALDNGMGVRPPMGFNPWNCFGQSAYGGCKLPLPWVHGGCHGFNESVILDVARAIKKTGLDRVGYKYINLDCGYSTGFRDEAGALSVNTTRFPHGMKWLGDQLHASGLKFGMYSDAGPAQCCSRIHPGANDGSYGHEQADAAQFASWGVDYLKHDDCGAVQSSFPAMRDAINATGRPMYYSVHGPTIDKRLNQSLPGPKIANCWRTTSDISNTWDSIIQRALLNNHAATLAAPGGFNDPDMLEVGNLFGPFGEAESRSHFSMWAVMKAPLLIGTDVTNMTHNTLSVLGNQQVVDVNQDSLGVQAVVVQNTSTQLSWAGPLSSGDYAVLVVNLAETSQTLDIKVAWTGSNSDGVTFKAVDLWADRSLPQELSISDQFVVKDVGAHDCVMIRLSRNRS